MKYDNAKTWIKIVIPLVILLIGFGIGYLVFNCNVNPNPTIVYLEEDLARLNKRHDSILRVYFRKDSIAAVEIIKQDSVIYKIKEDANQTIKKGVNNSHYNELIPSNRARGKQRFSE